MPSRRNISKIPRVNGLPPPPHPPPRTASPTPYPTYTRYPTQPPPAGCFDGMAYIKDLSYSDGGMSYYADVPAGQSFSKGWRIQNTGTCTWNAYYYIAFVSGTQMSGQPTSIQKYVYPGQTYDVYVNLVAPTTYGQYKAKWRLFNPHNYTFGNDLYVMIEAVPTATHTITPTRTVTPTRTSRAPQQQRRPPLPPRRPRQPPDPHGHPCPPKASF